MWFLLIQTLSLLGAVAGHPLNTEESVDAEPQPTLPIATRTVLWEKNQVSDQVTASVVLPSASTTTPVTNAPTQKYRNTCGYISGNPNSAVICQSSNHACFTQDNVNAGVHGCCNTLLPLSECILPTSCVPSASGARCTGACSSDIFITACTDSLFPDCYEMVYDYRTKQMTEYGCAAIAYTLTAQANLMPSTTTANITSYNPGGATPSEFLPHSTASATSTSNVGKSNGFPTGK
ncbi:hypothetical protein BCR34DRAFT_582083 [Clohesyomyces aquaticus]|uniref:Uncharacterized protein n=1 Tax=Clohesyomyces aquaticus TaxID=1231657 RepID=A0A1Y2AC77_9PLEO|nr:hypothetical protein BCR34DRAFT_582083 [Clohesyomyces aquaticus]